MIHGRIAITEPESALAVIEEFAATIADRFDLDLVKIEVEYPGEVWEESGDAVLVDFSDHTVQVTTLPPYSEVTP